MTTERERWQRLSDLFDRAIDLDDDARRALLDRECAGDPGLRAELQRMLDADAHATNGVLDAGVAAVVDLSGQFGIDDEPDAIGQALGPWRLQRLLGRGGMGRVYLAHRDGDADHRVAIKRLHRRWDGSLQAQRFLQERRILALLSHRNLPRLVDHGVDDDRRPWFALEFVEGRPLVAWADAQQLDLRTRIDLFRQVCDAVQHAHAHFVVHRDLKPSNILVDNEGHPKVLDFGVAKRIDADAGTTRTGVFAGFTPEYAAPEQISGGAITAATDVYALGVILYELLTGRLPYDIDSDDLRKTADAITSRTAERMERALTTGTQEEVAHRVRARDTSPAAFARFVRGDLTRIVQTALAKEPERRYASVQSLSEDLRQFLSGRPVSVSGDTFGYRARKFVQRNRWGVAMGGIALVAVIAGGIGILMQTQEARREAARANTEASRAEAEAQHAETEVERLSAVNGFLSSIFGAADPTRSATSQLTLKDALDIATKRAAEDHADQPQLQIRVMQAAAESYDSLGERDRAAALLRDALKIQERSLPGSREDRALLLSSLAYSSANYEPDNALRWAREGLALQRAANPHNLGGMLTTLSSLVAVQYANDDAEGAMATTREGLAVMERAGLDDTDPRYLGALSSLALTLGELDRHDESHEVQRRVIAARRKIDGGESRAVALERSYFAHSLLRAKAFDDALQQIEVAIPVLDKDLGPDNIETVSAHMRKGLALAGLGRHQQALPLLAKAHQYGQTHAFEGREQQATAAYAHSLAVLERCQEARAALQELARRGSPLHAGEATPLQGTDCQP